MAELILIITASFLLDMLLGDPVYRWHPVRIMGRIICRLETFLWGRGLRGRGGGVVLVLGLEAAVLLFYIPAGIAASRVVSWISWVLYIYICYSCLAMGDLLDHIRPVIRALEDGERDSARRLVAMVVGRDVSLLDGHGLGRAAVETMAENFVDGFLSPLFWYSAGGGAALLLGLPAAAAGAGTMLLFKGISTLDSMVGYKNERYIHFGWAAARLDDLANFLPARISLVFLFLGACTARSSPVSGLRIALRDRLKHDSPNAAHAESFLAGALGVRLGGPTGYAHGLKEKPWLGDGSPEVNAFHVRRAFSILRNAAWAPILSILVPLLVMVTKT